LRPEVSCHYPWSSWELTVEVQARDLYTSTKDCWCLREKLQTFENLRQQPRGKLQKG
jgi:hypothetical protein